MTEYVCHVKDCPALCQGEGAIHLQYVADEGFHHHACTCDGAAWLARLMAGLDREVVISMEANNRAENAEAKVAEYQHFLGREWLEERGRLRVRAEKAEAHVASLTRSFEMEFARAEKAEAALAFEKKRHKACDAALNSEDMALSHLAGREEGKAEKNFCTFCGTPVDASYRKSVCVHGVKS